MITTLEYFADGCVIDVILDLVILKTIFLDWRRLLHTYEKTYQPKYLKRWMEQINYEGENFDNYWVASWRYFRCSPVERSNFAYIREHLGDCGSVGDQVIFPAFTDAVMACRYYILVRSDFERGLRMADMFAERIARKGALDPDAEKRIDQEAVALTWRKSKLATRVALCQEAGVSVFAARREVLSSEPVMQLMSESA